MLPIVRSARSPILRVVPVILLTKKVSKSVQFRCKSTKSGHESEVAPVSPRAVPASANNRSWCATAGYGRNKIPSTQLNTAAFAPIPKVRHRIASTEKPGLRRSIRKPNRRSCSVVSIMGKPLCSRYCSFVCSTRQNYEALRVALLPRLSPCPCSRQQPSPDASASLRQDRVRDGVAEKG